MRKWKINEYPILNRQTFLETVQHPIVSLLIAKRTVITKIPTTTFALDACDGAVSTEEGTETPPADRRLVDPAPMFKKGRKNSRDERPTPSNNVQSASESSTICELFDADMTPFAPPPEAPPDMDPLEFDKLYENQSDSANQNANFSVLGHLLSQIRFGMDLTKVTLPTFILEKRSLLEMYADFFAHADLFVRIVDQNTPEERMIEVVRWYMSAFHAGRNADVAKKPYNPILGEIFKCHYTLPGTGSEKKPAIDGPCPWATEDDVTFVAEQVSHHPPVSAFYAECVSRGITCSAHIWTKSKFLGLSVSVQNCGQGCVSFQKFDEEYTCTFPTAYARSILGVPWVELGGDVMINCAKSGYQAKIDFLTKPFIGGKKHLVKGVICRPHKDNSRAPTPFIQISGAWNDLMTAKYLDVNETVEFFNPHTTPTIKKQVRPAVEMLPYESRRLWMNVTYSLRQGDVDKATEHKTFLEQRQRNATRERNQTGKRWKQRLFSDRGENWVYRNSLETRLRQGRRRDPGKVEN